MRCSHLHRLDHQAGEACQNPAGPLIGVFVRFEILSREPPALIIAVVAEKRTSPLGRVTTRLAIN